MTSLVGVERWRLPVEMRQRAQWCIAGPDKAPYLAGQNGLYRASPVKGPWLDFETACSIANSHGCGIGYIITEDDPYTCIDIDIKDAESLDKKTGGPLDPSFWTTDADLQFYRGIVQFAASYTELSSSGKGAHIWVLGNIGEGRRGRGLEVYSRERFMVCTGNAINDLQYHTINNVRIPRITDQTPLPIIDGTMLVQNLVRELGLVGAQIALTEVNSDFTDDHIWSVASSAGNSEKFMELCKGNWKQYKFPSQSEADLALMSMFTYYTKSNEQCRRMFRQTRLGDRDKATKNDVYLDRTLQIIRSRQAKENATVAHGQAIGEALLKNMEQAAPKGQAPQYATQDLKSHPAVQQMIANLDHTQHSEGHVNEVNYVMPEVEGLEWPPGLTGAIAAFIYNSAPRPVKEVAIVAALGLMAGITGKAYNVGQTGLNLYIILIARSAIGKEAMHSGIGHILKSPCGHVIAPFVNFTDYASGPALTKAMEGFTSFVNVSGEWGRKLQRMAGDRADGPMQGLRTAMTNLYQKSGSASVVGGLGYSDKEKNVASVNAVAYSMIGETTPGTFYDSLTDTMMEDGFLSRFNIVEYLGERPPENQNQVLEVPKDISDALANIASHCVGIVSSPQAHAIQVQMDEEASSLIADFNLTCDANINKAGSDEAIRQIWNRAHLKAVRVAGVLSAADNHIKPTVNLAHAEWAISLITSDTSAMLEKIKGGDIGVDDATRFKKLLKILEEFLNGKVSKSYSLDPRMVGDGIVPRSFLQKRTHQVRCFKNYRMGATLALDHVVKTAIDSGYIMEVAHDKAVEIYGYHGRCFRVLQLDDNE